MARPKIYEEETVVISVRLPVSLRERLSKMAKAGRRSLNQQILLMIDLGLSEETETGDTGVRPAAKRGRSRSS